MLEVKQLSKSFEGNYVLKNVSLSIEAGEIYGLIGANGSGKSTFLRLILGELKCFSGSIHLFGQSVSKFHTWHKIGYVPQIGLAKQMDFPATVKEVVQANLYSSLGLFRFPGKKETTKVEKTLSLLHMEDFSSRLIGELSGGQRQKVLLARALVSNPSLLILDEPTTGIDAESVQSFYQLLSHLHQETGLTILLISHDTEYVSNIANQIYLLENGTISEQSQYHTA